MKIKKFDYEIYTLFLKILNRLRHMMSLSPGGSVFKKATCNAEDVGSIPEGQRSPGEGNGNALQHSCLGNPMSKPGGLQKSTES